MACSVMVQRKDNGKGKQMDANIKGMRCRAMREVRSHRGLIKRSTEGTIQHYIENLGRELISVQWDVGITDYAFPAEIEIISEESRYPMYHSFANAEKNLIPSLCLSAPENL